VNLSESFIRKYYDLVPDTYRKEYILLNTPFNVIMDRNLERKGKYIPLKVLEAMRELKYKEEYKNFEWDN